MIRLDNQAPQGAPDSTQGEAAPAAADAAWRKKAGEAAEAFEAVFIREMLQTMDKGTQAIAGEDSLFSKVAGNGMMGVVQMAVADQIAHARAFGIADAILRQLQPPAGAAPLAPGAHPLKESAAPVALNGGETRAAGIALAADAALPAPAVQR